MGMTHLVARGLATEVRYDDFRITRLGTDRVESENAIRFDGSNYHYQKRRKGTALETASFSVPAAEKQTDWTKWGTIAALIGVAITCIAFVVDLVGI